MREIKFRAWDNDKMHKVSFNNLGVNFHHPSGILYLRQEQKPFGTTHETTLMQYTGLKDKHGVEIYEGDILGIDCGVTGVVKYDVGGTAFYIDVIEYKDTFNVEDGETVIGNVYENKELLEVKHD